MGRLGLARLGPVAPHRPGLARLGQPFAESATDKQLCEVMTKSQDLKLRLSAALNLATSAQKSTGSTDWYICNCFLLGLQDPEAAMRAAAATAIGQLGERASGVCTDANGLPGPRTRVVALLSLMQRVNESVENSAEVRKQALSAISNLINPGDVAVVDPTSGNSIYALLVATLNAVASIDSDDGARAQALQIRDALVPMDPSLPPSSTSPTPPAVRSMSPLEKGLIVAGAVTFLGAIGYLVVTGGR